ncbi:hypothetical protein H4Q32_002341 [Labeo rohita]|uniref:Uncharacterized protein n=2 Tax=Labeo rohita TaxID=84645 RepID=A0ABQ8MN09_LABRO|nr:hypothetical protein H4Q32_002341 [Labeo rohita]
MKAESGEEEFESEEGEELAMEEEEQANEEEEFKSEEEEEQANEEEEEANKGEGPGGKGPGGRARQPRTIITDEMRATVIDHVIVHGMTMAEAGLRVRPNLSRFTVATIIRAFRQHNRVERMPHRGGRVAIFTVEGDTGVDFQISPVPLPQKKIPSHPNPTKKLGKNPVPSQSRKNDSHSLPLPDFVSHPAGFPKKCQPLIYSGTRNPHCVSTMRVTVGGMVRENNLIRLREIRDKVIADNVNFESIDVSLATIDRVLRRQKMWMKQVYRVPFERNSARHKDLHYEYVQRILQLDAIARPHEYLFLDEAGFNLQK